MSSTTSDEAASADPRYLEVFHQYFENEATTPSLARFYEFDSDIIIHSSPRSRIKEIWNKRFLTAAEKFNVKTVCKDQPNWENIYEAILQARVDDQKPLATASSNSSTTTTTTTTGKRSRSATSSSKTDSCMLSPSAKARFRSEFEKMSNQSKWLLRTNDDGSKVYVEDLMYKHGEKCDYEHAVHSWILDLEDRCWEEVFTAEELETLKITGCPRLPPIPEPATKLFKKCADALLEVDGDHDDKVVDALWKAITEDGFFDPRTQQEQEWIQRTLLDYLSLYRHGLVENIMQQGSEMDYVVRFWSNLDKCLDNVALTLRDQSCLPTLIRTNAERSTFGVGPIDDQQRSVRPDTLVIKDGIHYALSECGKEDLGGIGKKEIVERRLHAPKILKDLFTHALREGRQQKKLARLIKIVGWTQNGPRMRMSVLDCPAGYVCRLLHTNEYKVPKRPSEIPASLFPLLKLALKTKAVVKATIAQIQVHTRTCDDDDPDLLSPKTNILKLPATMTLVNKKPRC